MATVQGQDAKTSITPLLKRLWHESAEAKPDANEIAAALSLIFTNSLSEVQIGALLTCLHFTDRDRQADVLTKCAESMRNFATAMDTDRLSKLLAERGRKEGSYSGGLVCSIRVLSTRVPSVFFHCSVLQLGYYSDRCSVILSAQVVTPTTRSTFPPHHQS